MDTLRKNAKGMGVDCVSARKHREEKCIQIRKDKRFDRTTMQRMKCMEEQQPCSSSNSSKKIVKRRLDLLPSKKELILKDDVESQLDGVTYIRKVLAVDKFPPIDLIMESGVVPRLIEFLGRFDYPKLQLEAAWAITNVACGEPRHTRELVSLGVVPPLIAIISNSPDNIREQALWALGNVSGDSENSRDILLEAGVLQPLLWQLGIDAPVHLSVTSPSLATMRHVAWTFANITRVQPPLPVEVMGPILYALAELIQSPDEELLNDVCVSLSLILEASSESVQICLEQGLLSRLVEMGGSSSALSAAAVRVICALGRSASPLHRRVFTRKKYRCSQLVVHALASSEDNALLKDIFTSLSYILTTEHKLLSELIALDVLSTIEKSVAKSHYDLALAAGKCLGVMTTECSEGEILRHTLQIMNALLSLLGTTDILLLSSTLMAIRKVVSVILTLSGRSALESNVWMDTLRDRMTLLSNYPNNDINNIAATVESLIDGTMVITDDIYDDDSKCGILQSNSTLGILQSNSTLGSTSETVLFGLPENLNQISNGNNSYPNNFKL